MDLDEALKGNTFYQFIKIRLADDTYREYKKSYDEHIAKLEKMTRFMPKKTKAAIWGALSMAGLLEYHTTVLACEYMVFSEDSLPLAACLKKFENKD